MVQSIYDFEVKDLAGKTVKLADYKGRVLLIVNIASECGLTPQLGKLEKLYEKYKERGFEILAFPSNDFKQEPENNNGILQFCSDKYGVKFKIFNKDKVRGSGAQPLYKYLAVQKPLGFIKNYPIWNFHKYIIDRNGRVVDYFMPWKWPDDEKLTGSIEKCLAQRAVEN